MKISKKEFERIYYDDEFKGPGFWHMTLIFMEGGSGGLHLHHLGDDRREVFQIWLSEEDIAKVQKMLADAKKRIAKKKGG